MSFRDISKKIKQYDKNQQLETKKENSENKRKVVLKSSQAYELFLDGKSPVDVGIALQLDFEKVRKYWKEFLRLRDMKRLYQIYVESEFKLKYIFKIYYFILRNKIDFKEIESVLKSAHEILQLNKNLYNLKLQVNMFEQKRSNAIL